MKSRIEIEKSISPVYINYENGDSCEEPFRDYVKRILEIQTELLLDIREKIK